MKPAEFLNELSNEKLAKYKTAAAADAKKADSEGDYKRGDKRFSGIVKATKKQFANDEKKEVDEAYGRNSYAYRKDGGANDERHDLDPSDWYFVKDGKMFAISVYPRQEQEAIARGYSRTRAEAKAKAGQQGVSEEKQRLDPSCWKGYKKQGTKMKGDTRVNNCVPVKESAILQGLNQLDEGWKEKLGAAALAGSMALGSGGAHARVTPDGQGGFTGGLKPSATVTAPSDNKPAAEAPKGFSKEYLQKAANPDRIGRYMISVEKAQELLKSMP